MQRENKEKLVEVMQEEEKLIKQRIEQIKKENIETKKRIDIKEKILAQLSEIDENKN